MVEPIAVLTSDLHLSPNAWPSRPTIRGDSLWGFQQVVDIACEIQAPIFAAGDLLDCKKPKPSLIADIQHMIVEKEVVCGFPHIYFIQGQHDLDKEVPWLEVITPYAHHMDVNRSKETLHFPGDVTLTGLDWCTQTQMCQTLEDLEDPGGELNILMMHQIYKPFLPVIPVAELYPDWVPDWVDILLLGDFHEAIDTVHTNANGSSFRVISPGPVSMQRITEDPAKSVFVLWQDFTITQQELWTRPVMDVPELHTPEDFDAFSEDFDDEIFKISEEVRGNLPESQQKPLVYIRYYEGVVPDAKHRISSVVGEKGHLFLKPLGKDSELEEELEELDKILDKEDQPMLKCLPQVCDPVSERWVFDLLTQLLSSEMSYADPQRIVSAFREKVLEGKLNVENTQATPE